MHLDNTGEAFGAVNPARDRLRQQRLRTAELSPPTTRARKITAEVNGRAGWLSLAKSAAAHGRTRLGLLRHRLRAAAPQRVFGEAGPLDPADVVVQRLGAPRTAFGHRRTRGLTSLTTTPRASRPTSSSSSSTTPKSTQSSAATDARLAVAAFTGTLLAPSLDDQPGRSHGLPTVQIVYPSGFSFADPALISRSV